MFTEVSAPVHSCPTVSTCECKPEVQVGKTEASKGNLSFSPSFSPPLLLPPFPTSLLSSLPPSLLVSSFASSVRG